jgi:hypothetical protein
MAEGNRIFAEASDSLNQLFLQIVLSGRSYVIARIKADT